MSRVGRLPVPLPAGVKAEIAGQLLKVTGPKGTLQRSLRPEVQVVIEDGELVFKRTNETAQARAFHGMERALGSNMVEGVATGFAKEMELVGVGYKAAVKGDAVELGLGYSHPIRFELPKGIKASVREENRQIFVKLEGMDRQLVGQTAAKMRSLRKPEPFKGKGVRYVGEVIKIKTPKVGKK